MSRSMDKLSVVIPLYNEAAHLRSTLETICRHTTDLHCDYELILIDDGSTDDTWKEIQAYWSDNRRVRAVRLSRRFGKELALCAGLERAAGDAAIVMDGDLQHPPELIPQMVERWEEGYDVVEAVKSKGGKPAAGTAKSSLFYSLFRRMAGIDLTGASDYKLLGRRVLQAWARMPERNVFFRGMSVWLGFRRKRIPMAVAKSARGRSRWSTLGLVRLAVTGITSFSSLPIHIITASGVVFLAFSLVFGLYALVLWIRGSAVTGFTTVIILQLLVGSMLVTALGIIGQYVSKIYDEVKGRPRFIVADTLEPRSE
ncbi:MAG: glycosyltransferase family 2 protein [Candidatus Eisenbacteria bacterium]